jgi:hypothetical protein
VLQTIVWSFNAILWSSLPVPIKSLPLSVLSEALVSPGKRPYDSGDDAPEGAAPWIDV